MFQGVLILLVVGFFLAGCAMNRKAVPADDLQARINEMEKRVQEKDDEIQDIKDEIQDLDKELKRSTAKAAAAPKKVMPDISRSDKEIIRVNASIKDVQTALKSAGYYSGNVDGKVGEKTKQAIKAFQQANDLRADGVIGQRTWDKLKAYLNKENNQ